MKETCTAGRIPLPTEVNTGTLGSNLRSWAFDLGDKSALQFGGQWSEAVKDETVCGELSRVHVEASNGPF